MARAAWFVVIAVLIGSMAGCGNPIRDKIEHGIRDSLPEMIGPADVYEVRVYGATPRLLKGKLDGLDIDGANVVLPNGLKLANLDVKIRDLVVDPKTKELKKAGSTDYTAVIAEHELNRYVTRLYPDVPDLNIDLRSGYVTTMARPGLSKLKVMVEADTKVNVINQRVVALDFKKMDVAGVGLPGAAVNYLESKLDAIFDAQDLGFDARITSVSITNSSITLAGTLDLMKGPAQ